MRKSFRIISLFLLIVFSFSCFACSNEDTPDNKEQQGQQEQQKEIEYKDGLIAKDGSSDYVIIMPSDATAKENLAKQELIELFRLSTEVELTSKIDDEISSKNGKYIFIGQNKFLHDFNINPLESELGDQGYIVKTIDDSVVITGANRDGYGTLYGVYEFLSYQIGFECYAEDETYVDEYKELKLVSVDIKDKPDIPNMWRGSNNYVINSTYQYRTRYIAHTDLFTGGISPYHNSFIFLPPNTYKADHPDWYSNDSSQLCYTAHGNQEEYDAFINELFDVFLQKIELDSSIRYLALNIQDTNSWCSCSACKNCSEKYGSNSASIVLVLNKISKMFIDYFENNNIDRKLEFMFFCYNQTFNAPVVKNADGTYSPTYEEVRCADNVYPFVCTFGAKRYKSFTDPANSAIYNTIEGWRSISKKIALWTYSLNYSNNLFPYDCVNCITENYRYIASINPFFLKEEAESANYHTSGFMEMKFWLEYKMAWDTSRNIDDLINEYFEHYFQDAAKPMMKYYVEYRLAIARAVNEYGYDHFDNYTPPKNIFTFGLLKNWQGYIKEAYDSILYLKDSNPELYTKLYNRICLESLSVNYTMLYFYEAYFSSTDATRLKEQVRNDAVIARVSLYNENGHGYTEDLFK